MSKTSLLIIFVLLLPAAGRADWQDPTKPGGLTIPGDANSSEVVPSETPILSAVKIAGRHRHATINGITVKQGTTLPNGAKLLHVRPHSVVIIHNGVKQTLQLLPVSIKRR